MSIHKSQGQSGFCSRGSGLEYDLSVAALERVKVDLGKVFEKGQAYVALSRATCLEGLQVMGFSADKVRTLLTGHCCLLTVWQVMAHRKVAVWSSSLRDLNV